MTTIDPKAKSALEDKIKAAVRREMERNKSGSTMMEAIKEAAPVKVEPDLVEEIDRSLQPGQKWFTDLIGIDKETLKSKYKLDDFGCTVLDPATVDANVSAFVPKVSPTYVFQIEEAHAALMGLECNDKVLTTGPTGSGKSTMWEQLCALTNRPYIRINSSVDMESATFFGNMVAEKGETPWKDGPITEAVRYGAVACIDEWDVTPAEILFGLQWLFEKNGKLYLKEMPGTSKDKFITPHDNFRLVCCGNTVGQGDETGKFTGTAVQNTATIDRFGTTIYLGYLPAEHEETMLKKAIPALSSHFVARMVQLAKLVRIAYEQGNIALTMSPRTLLNWGNKMVMLNDGKVALMRAFSSKLRESDKRIVDELYFKCFGKK